MYTYLHGREVILERFQFSCTNMKYSIQYTHDKHNQNPLNHMKISIRYMNIFKVGSQNIFKQTQNI